MLTKSGVKLLDFGLAKPFAATPKNVSSSIAATMTHSPLTSEDTLVGTFQYMAPEQLEGRDADARSDLFAFGCVLYEMATGKRAFDGKSTASVVASIMNSEPAPVSTIAPLTPPTLEWAIRKCLAKDPEERWQSAADLASEIRWIQEGGSRAGVAVPVTARSRRKLLRWAALAAAVLVGGVVGFFARKPAPERVLHVAINICLGTVSPFRLRKLLPRKFGEHSQMMANGSRMNLTNRGAEKFMWSPFLDPAESGRFPRGEA